MKRILSTLLAASLMLLGTQAFAQMSVNAGYLNSTMATSGDPVNSNGAYAGLSYNIPVAGGLSIAPGIYYSLIGGKQDVLAAGKWAQVDATFTEHAINVPVYLNYGIGLSRDTKFFVYAGPTCQYGLASQYKVQGSSSALTDLLSKIGISAKAEGSSIVNNYDDADFNRFNVYLGGGIGINAGGIIVNVGYDYGMLNQYKGDNAPKAHRSNLKIGIGYEF